MLAARILVPGSKGFVQVTDLLRRAITLLGVLILLASGCGKNAPGTADFGAADAGMKSTILAPLPTEPTTRRWRDIGDALYARDFRDEGFYSGSGRAARVEWMAAGTTLTGRISLERLKPNFAYQVKLVGTVPTGEGDTARIPIGSAQWACAVLGASGRWCLGPARANVRTDQATAMLKRGAPLVGYMLFDFIVTDARGNATRDIRLDSSYHVLWRSEQRDRNRRDSPVRVCTVSRGRYGYGADATGERDEVTLFAEREVPHPGHGQVRLPPGKYQALINLTEESFHANQKEPLEAGGFWAQVLEAPIEFTVTR